MTVSVRKGTGKTLTGVKLVYWFVQMNKLQSENCRPVLYCAPSNSAVDVAMSKCAFFIVKAE